MASAGIAVAEGGRVEKRRKTRRGRVQRYGARAFATA